MADKRHNLTVFPLKHGETTMIVRKLRSKQSWSQEQLADFCGLNVRTIQRVESGQKASTETLKCIASVFEVDISTLTEEITVIDKNSENWKQLPWWYRFNMCGVSSRSHLLKSEMLFLAIGVIYWVFSINPVITPFFFVSAYLFGWLIRYGDSKKIWF